MSRTYACSDLHGQKDLWNQIKDFLQPDDTLYFLGDAIDRGKDGFLIMQELIADSRVIYLKGNHELMMQNSLMENINNQSFWRGEEARIWYNNGSRPTMKAWIEDGPNFNWINILKKLPLKAEYKNIKGQTIYLSHAGFTPGAEPEYEFDLVWDRNHLFQEIPKKYLDNKTIIVHGHTPTKHLIKQFKKYGFSNYKEENRIVFYNDIKIDVDCGSYTTGCTALLNLDTLEIISFKEAI